MKGGKLAYLGPAERTGVWRVRRGNEQREGSLGSKSNQGRRNELMNEGRTEG